MNEYPWSAPDEMASEYEVFDFLYGLVRLIKPHVVVETGTYRGHSAETMGQAIKANGFGSVFTAETDKELLREAEKRFIGLPVYTYHDKGIKMLESIAGPIDLAYIDSGDRKTEILYLQNSGKLSKRAYVLFHDAFREEFQEVAAITNWWNFTIPTKRGLGIFVIGK